MTLLRTPPTATADDTGHATPALLERLARLVTLAPGPREWIDVRAPYTGALLGRIPHGTADDVAEAVRRARAAQLRWAATRVAERGAILLRFHDLLLAQRDVALDLVQLEAGKARRDAFEEVADTAVVTRHYAVHAEALLRPRRRRGAVPLLTSTREYRQPVGVVGCISPWNYPLNLPVTDMAAALMAGNTAVIKPDHQTSFTLLWALELLRRAGLPPDVLGVVTGEGPELGTPLIEAVDYVMFTGSTRTGRVVARQAAERLVGCSLELGGKNPMLVFADAALDRAVHGAVRGAFVGAGQVCVSMERLYVERAVHDAFVERLVALTRALRLSAALDFGGDVGSLTSERQLATVTRHVEDARARGATILAGGRRRPDVGPLFYEPTLVAGATPAMELYAEETFGPVLAIYPFDDEEEAVARANDTRYGLCASVWTRSRRRALRVATRLRVGSVGVNDPYGATWSSVAAPIGGMRDSGLGRRHGREGLLKYTETQTVAVQRLAPVSGPPALPAERYAGAVSGLLRLLRHLPGLR